MGRIYERIDEHQRHGSPSSRCSSWARPRRATDGHVNVSPEGPDRLAAGARRPHRRLPGHRRQRRGDDRPPARERAHLRDVLRVRGPAADPAPARPAARYVLPGDAAVRRAAARWASHEPEAPEARRAIIVVHVHPDRRLLRLRRAADGLRGRAPAHATSPPPSACGSRARTRCATTRQSTTASPSTACPALLMITGRPRDHVRARTPRPSARSCATSSSWTRSMPAAAG